MANKITDTVAKGLITAGLLGTAGTAIPQQAQAQTAGAINSGFTDKYNNGCVVNKSGTAVFVDVTGNQVYELRGGDFRSFVGHKVDTVGFIDRAAQHVLGATAVVYVAGMDRSAVNGNCEAVAARIGATVSAANIVTDGKKPDSVKDALKKGAGAYNLAAMELAHAKATGAPYGLAGATGAAGVDPIAGAAGVAGDAKGSRTNKDVKSVESKPQSSPLSSDTAKIIADLENKIARAQQTDEQKAIAILQKRAAAKGESERASTMTEALRRKQSGDRILNDTTRTHTAAEYKQAAEDLRYYADHMNPLATAAATVTLDPAVKDAIDIVARNEILNNSDDKDNTVFDRAIITGNVSLAEALIVKFGISPTTGNSDVSLQTLITASNATRDIPTVIATAGAAAGAAGAAASGVSFFIVTAMTGNTQMTDMLLSHGAKIDKEDRAILLAIASGKKTPEQILRDSGLEKEEIEKFKGDAGNINKNLDKDKALKILEQINQHSSLGAPQFSFPSGSGFEMGTQMAKEINGALPVKAARPSFDVAWNEKDGVSFQDKIFSNKKSPLEINDRDTGKGRS